MERVTILIADDHAVVRQGLRAFLELDPAFEVVGEACDGGEAIMLARELLPDVVLMDLVMPEVGGLEAISAIRRELPNTEVIALTSYLEDGVVQQAMQAGAMGYLLKDVEAPELRQAIRAAAAGQVQLSPRAVAKLLKTFDPMQSREALTPRETDVLRLLARGQSNKEIAQSLTISETTAKTHVRSILSKLGVASRLQATLYAIRSGIV